jgi:hypothetical protein
LTLRTRRDGIVVVCERAGTTRWAWCLGNASSDGRVLVRTRGGSPRATIVLGRTPATPRAMPEASVKGEGRRTAIRTANGSERRAGPKSNCWISWRTLSASPRAARAPGQPGDCGRVCTGRLDERRIAASRRRQSESPSFSWQGSRVRDRVGSAYSSPQSTAPRVSRRLLLLTRASESERNARVERPRVSRARCASIGGAQPRGMHAHTQQ